MGEVSSSTDVGDVKTVKGLPIAIGPHLFGEEELQNFINYCAALDLELEPGATVGAILELAFSYRQQLGRILPGAEHLSDPYSPGGQRGPEETLNTILIGVNQAFSPEIRIQMEHLTQAVVKAIAHCLTESVEPDTPVLLVEEVTGPNERKYLPSLELPLHDGSTLQVHEVSSIRRNLTLITTSSGERIPLLYYLLRHYLGPEGTPLSENLPQAIQDLLNEKGGDYLVITHQDKDGSQKLLQVSRRHSVVDIDFVLTDPQYASLPHWTLLPPYSSLTQLQKDEKAAAPKWHLPPEYLSDPVILAQKLSDFLDMPLDDLDEVELARLADCRCPYDLATFLIDLSKPSSAPLMPMEQIQRQAISQHLGGVDIAEIFPPSSGVLVPEMYESASGFIPGENEEERRNHFYFGLLGELHYNLDKAGVFTVYTLDEFYVKLLEQVDAAFGRKSFLILGVQETEDKKQYVLVVHNQNMVEHLHAICSGQNPPEVSTPLEVILHHLKNLSIGNKAGLLEVLKTVGAAQLISWLDPTRRGEDSHPTISQIIDQILRLLATEAPNKENLMDTLGEMLVADLLQRNAILAKEEWINPGLQFDGVDVMPSLPQQASVEWIDDIAQDERWVLTEGFDHPVRLCRAVFNQVYRLILTAKWWEATEPNLVALSQRGFHLIRLTDTSSFPQLINTGLTQPTYLQSGEPNPYLLTRAPSMRDERFEIHVSAQTINVSLNAYSQQNPNLNLGTYSIQLPQNPTLAQIEEAIFQALGQQAAEMIRVTTTGESGLDRLKNLYNSMAEFSDLLVENGKPYSPGITYKDNLSILRAIQRESGLICILEIASCQLKPNEPKTYKILLFNANIHRAIQQINLKKALASISEARKALQ